VVHETQQSSSTTNLNFKTNQSDLKDTNFEYEDNEWDIGIFILATTTCPVLTNCVCVCVYVFLGIGDLIIDLDADIEKSSSTNLDSSLVIPLQQQTSQVNLGSSPEQSVDPTKELSADHQNLSKSAKSGKQSSKQASSKQ